jgi:ribonuclease T2
MEMLVKNKSILAIAVSLLLLGCNTPATFPKAPAIPEGTSPQQARVARGETAAQPFDYYLLNLSWSPEFCHSHPNATECAQHSTFVLHGLWPQNKDGTYPENCSNQSGPRNPTAYGDIYPDAGLLIHEWRTHGTCSGLSPDAFFSLARQAFHSVVIPSALSQLDHQISIPPGQILDLFTAANPSVPRSSLALSCGNNYLTAIEVCLNKNAQPTACGPVRSCRANTVRIPPP